MNGMIYTEDLSLIHILEREIEITSGWGEYELAIKGVRAFVCEECGAISLRAEEVKMME